MKWLALGFIVGFIALNLRLDRKRNASRTHHIDDLLDDYEQGL